MQVLVTGANGFVGSHLCQELLARGHRVVALVRQTSDTSSLEGLGVEKRHGDVNQPETLFEAFAGVEVVFHVAGLTKARFPADFDRVNRGGSEAVAAAARAAGVRRVVQVSSIAASGPSQPGRPRVEGDPPQPVSLYGASKWAGEQAMLKVAGEVEVVVVRPPIVYGPREYDFLELIRVAAKGVVVQAGSRPQRYSVIHCRDLTRGLILAAERGQRAEIDGKGGVGIYFLTDGLSYSWRELGQEAARAVGRRALHVILPLALAWLAAVGSEWLGRLRGKAPILSRDKIREAAVTGWWVSTEKARSELGYEPQVPLREGLLEEVEWARGQGLL